MAEQTPRNFQCRFFEDCPPFKNAYRPFSFCCCACEHKTEVGCRLGDQRPPRCKEYDCRDYRFYVGFDWNGKAWQLVSLSGVPIGNCTKNFVDRYNQLIQGGRISVPWEKPQKEKDEK